MNRILPETVLEAYAQTGLHPEQYITFLQRRAVCCGIGAIAKAFYPETIKKGWLELRVLENLSSLSMSYIDGYMTGWDGFSSHSDNEENLLGYEDGRAGWEAAKEAYLDSNNK